jgi:acetyl esterase/lipase
MAYFIMKKIFPLLLVALSVATCKKEELKYLPADTQLNVAYGSDPAQKMDIYLPFGRNINPGKVIILIHGGGWNQGDKNDFTSYVDTLKKRLPGYAIFNINYRLATGSANLFPTQENDIKAAVDFIYSKKSEYYLNDKYVMLGASAGGHMALLYSYKYSNPVKIKAVVDFFGPTELVSLYNSGPLAQILLTQVIGGTPATHASMYQQSSPENFITAQTAPTIILQGGVDPLVPFSQAVLLKNTLQANGVMHQYVFYPNEGHGWTGANLTDSFEKIAAFLAAQVH